MPRRSRSARIISIIAATTRSRTTGSHSASRSFAEAVAELRLQRLADRLQIIARIETARDLADVFAERLAVAKVGGAGERIDLRAGVVDVVFARHRVAGRGEHVGDRRRRPPRRGHGRHASARSGWPRRIRRSPSRRRRPSSGRRTLRREGSPPSCAAQNASERRRLTKPGPATSTARDVGIRFEPRRDSAAPARAASCRAASPAPSRRSSRHRRARHRAAARRRFASSASPAAASPSAPMTLSTAARIRCSNMCEEVHQNPAAGGGREQRAIPRNSAARPRLAQIGSIVKQPLVLGNRVAVGHAGDVIGNAPRRPERIAADRGLHPIRPASSPDPRRTPRRGRRSAPRRASPAA